MSVQTLKQSTGITEKPFVVKESDLEIFSCEELLSTTPPTQRCTFPKRKSTRRSSTCSSSTASSKSSMSSKSSYSDDNESMASDFGEISIASKHAGSRTRGRRSRRRLSSTSAKPKKSVQFHSRISVRDIPHLSQLSDEDITHRWYRKSELAAIESDAGKTIRNAKENGVDTVLDDSTHHTVRRLNCSKKQKRRNLWVMALSCVLDEQKRQAREGVDDPESLACIYRSFAFTSEQKARDNGRRDADVVRRLR
jgi:hypothetical protein